MDEVLFLTASGGRSSKAMLAWKHVFKQENFVDVLAYPETIQDG